MPDLETVVDQPSAETSDTEQYTDDSLPADSPADSPSETQNAEDAEGTESVESESEGDSQAESESESESEQEPQGDDFLAKLELSPEELAYYAKRYPTLYKAAQSPNQPADLRQAFADRVNQDRAYAELRDGQNQEGETEEPTQQTPQPDAAEQRKQYYQQIEQAVEGLDRQSLNDFGMKLMLGPNGKLEDLKPEERTAKQEEAEWYGRAFASGATDIVASLLPRLIPELDEMRAMAYEKIQQTLWDNLRNQTAKGPGGVEIKPYAKLPAIGTPQWNTEVDKVLEQMPELRDMFDHLPPRERYKKQYAIAAKLMSGQQVNPAVVAQAVDTGKKLARKAEVNRAAGRALGAGRSTQQLGQQSDEDDPVMADLDRAIVSANESLSPLSRPKKR